MRKRKRERKTERDREREPERERERETDRQKEREKEKERETPTTVYFNDRALHYDDLCILTEGQDGVGPLTWSLPPLLLPHLAQTLAKLPDTLE